MMKIFVSIILVLIVLASCNFQDDKTAIESSESSSTEQEIKNLPENKLSVIIIDDCEYIIYKEDKDGNSSYGFMSHK